MDVTERGVSCPSCRQSFATEAELARHESLDHLPDPEGLALARALDLAGPGDPAHPVPPRHLLAVVVAVLGTVAALTVLLAALSG